MVLKCGICYIIMGTYLDTDTERIICSYILKVFQKQSISNKTMVKKHRMIFSGSTMQLCVTLTDFLPCLNKILKKSCNLVQTEAFFPQWDLVFWQKKCQYYLFSLFATLLRLSTPLSLYRTHPTKKMTCTHKSSVRPIFLQTIGEDAFISDFEAKSIWSFCYWSKRSIGL